MMGRNRNEYEFTWEFIQFLISTEGQTGYKFLLINWWVSTILVCMMNIEIEEEIEILKGGMNLLDYKLLGLIRFDY